jgi:hypothetical protein
MVTVRIYTPTNSVSATFVVVFIMIAILTVVQYNLNFIYICISFILKSVYNSMCIF